LATDPLGRERFAAELAGLTLIHERSGVTTPTPVGSGILTVNGSVVLLMQALWKIGKANFHSFLVILKSRINVRNTHEISIIGFKCQRLNTTDITLIAF
jgi:hypothetical protein